MKQVVNDKHKLEISQMQFKGKIHSFETLGGLDGPGIRTVIFLQGCPMRCKYCHNADTFDVSGGIDMTVKETIEFCRRYKNYYGEKGGVTLSGGEPLFQSEFIIALLEAFKRENIHTVLDTSGCVYAPRALDLADLIILDIKHTDPAEFEKLTGHSMENTLKTLEYCKLKKHKYWIRQVIACGITDNESQVAALKAMSGNAEKIELLPYHDMGKDKWEKAGLEYQLFVDPPTIELMEKLHKLVNF